MNPSLRDLQRWMGGVIVHPEDATKALQQSSARWRTVIQETEDLKREARLDIYGNAYYLRLIECLGENFSAVRNAIGSHEFSHLAHAYLGRHPSTFRSVEDVGATLAGFIKGHPIAKKFPFLSDLATMEWAAHEAFYADDVPAFDSAVLQNIQPENWPLAKISLDTSAHLLALKFNLSQLWRADGKWSQAKLKKIQQKISYVLIFRRLDHKVRLQELDPKQYALLKKLTGGHSLGKCMSSLKNQRRALPIQSWFREWMENGIIRSIQFKAR